MAQKKKISTPKGTLPKKSAKTASKEAAPPPRSYRKPATVMSAIRKKVEEKLTNDVHKASLGDYIRLVQLEKELEEEPAEGDQGDMGGCRRRTESDSEE